ncbi:MAG: hypothetical protein JXR12_06555 [Neptunomonas phycophila]|uniref:hypothetical protein n=1 Tax=Neptunomonas phycophila TaxID=1572645 RepID=UPI003B8AEF57
MAKVQTNSRENSKMAKALAIFHTEMATENSDTSLRQRCIAQFQSELGQAQVTAATYYNLCVQKAETAQVEIDDKVIASKRQHKFSAVRTENASSDVAKKVHYFFSRKAAQTFASNFNYSGVVKGIVEPGQVAAF